MDLSVLPNNNHPDKFLQLEVKSLVTNSALPQANFPRLPGGNYPAMQHWHNLVYSQREKRNVAEQLHGKLSVKDSMIIDSILGDHITSFTLKRKNNLLYGDIRIEEAMEERKQRPSWTIQDYDKHSVQSNLSGYLKENPNDLRFWLGDTYTPGYDALLKKKEQQQKQSKCCRISLIVLVPICILVSIITVCNFLT
ncbi:major intrinsically disordered NOTCH2-binding receptor 1-like [Gracilinanus agilis]|uniref:major intrinsically disordered NOTCH2-binding receptor 1-like n=1 Tax=Gracilinanus agilis TaxID=191870 RepID=UPI001CFE5143|nr:major intrinsically disordered NOTCH2-binding receptor 1-like [Gracilinanus agilis]